MNIDCKNNTITCDCGNTVQIKDAELYHCSDCQSYHFDCDHCNKEGTIPLAFNDYLTTEISKHVLQSEDNFDGVSEDFADIFLGQNQVPLTNELIDYLVKEKGMNRKELISMQKDGAQYSVSRNSFIFPLEGDLDKIF